MKVQPMLVKRFSPLLVLALVVLWDYKPTFGQEQQRWLSEKFGFKNYLNGGSEVYTNSAREETAYNVKSEHIALAWSLFGTLVPVTAGILIRDNDLYEGADGILIVGGVIVGPSLGYFYGGCAGEGLLWLGIRACLISIPAVLRETSPNAEDGRAIFFILGLLAFTSAVADISQVEEAVRKRNQSMEKTTLTVTPKFFYGSKANGLELKIMF